MAERSLKFKWLEVGVIGTAPRTIDARPMSAEETATLLRKFPRWKSEDETAVTPLATRALR